MQPTLTTTAGNIELAGDGELVRKLFSAHPQPMWVFDNQTLAILAVNEAACRHYGYSQAEFLTMTLRDIRPPSEVTRLDTHFSSQQASLHSGLAPAELWIHQKKDGEVIYVEITANDLVFNGRPARWAMIRDVTEQQRLGMGASAELVPFRGVVDRTRLLISLVALEGRIITDINQAALDAYGYTREQVIGRSMNDIIIWADPAVRAHYIAELVANGSMTNFEADMLRADGDTFTVSLSASIVTISNSLFILSSMTDVTEARRAERARDALQKISEATQVTASLPALCGRIHEIIGALLPAKNFYVAMYDAKQGLLSFPYHVDERDTTPEPRQLQGFALSEEVLRSGKVLLLDAAQQRARVQAGHQVAGTLASAWLGVPLVCQGRPVGVLAVQSYDDSVRFSPNDVALLQFVSEQIANALEKKHGEEALRENEQKFRALFDQSPLIICLFSVDGETEIDVNDAGRKAFGGSGDDRATPDQGPLVEWADPAEKAAYLSTLQRDGAVHEFEACMRRRNGEEFTVRMSGSLIQVGGQEFSLNILADITEQRRAEQELRQSREWANLLYENTSDLMFLVGRGDDGSYHCLSVNSAYLATTGMRADAIIGRRIEDVLPPTAAAFAVARYDQAIAANTSIRYEEVVDFGDHVLTVETTLTPAHGDEGEGVYLLGVARDISERRNAETALLQSNADLEQFAYSVSHDMRQPLRMVTGHLQLVGKALKDKLDGDTRASLDFALDGAKRMDEMIVSLLEYSRVGRTPSDRDRVDTRASIDEAISFLGPAIAAADAKVTVSGTWPQIISSRDELTRLMQNLVGNAIKFMRTGEAPTVAIVSEATPKTWRVRVTDNGIGISESQRSRLFQFFSRLNAPAKFDGSGMGLALCRRIVERHGGRIWVESDGLGTGATFILEIPRKSGSMAGDADA